MKKILSLSLIIFVLINFFVVDSAFAEKGDFWEKHKGEFENYPDSYTDVVKVFDSETMTFHCGTF